MGVILSFALQQGKQLEVIGISRGEEGFQFIDLLVEFLNLCSLCSPAVLFGGRMPTLPRGGLAGSRASCFLKSASCSLREWKVTMARGSSIPAKEKRRSIP